MALTEAQVVILYFKFEIQLNLLLICQISTFFLCQQSPMVFCRVQLIELKFSYTYFEQVLCTICRTITSHSNLIMRYISVNGDARSGDSHLHVHQWRCQTLSTTWAHLGPVMARGG